MYVCRCVVYARTVQYHLKFCDTLAWVSQYTLGTDTCYYMDKMLVIVLLVHILTHCNIIHCYNFLFKISYCILRGRIKGFNSAIYAIKCQQVVGASLSEPHTGGSRFNRGTIVVFLKVYARTWKAPHC